MLLSSRPSPNVFVPSSTNHSATIQIWMADSTERRWRTAVIGRIDRLVADPHKLAELSRWSYRHPNGFEKIPLNFSSLGRRFWRLHVWDRLTPTDPPPEHSDPHSHPWQFVSRVLAGALVSEEFRRGAHPSRGAPKEYAEVRFHVDARPGLNSSERIGTATLTRIHTTTLAAGVEYKLPPHAIHRVYGSAGNVTITLVRQLPIERRWSEAFIAEGALTHREEFATQFERFSSEHLKARLSAVRDSLATISGH